MTTRRKMEGAVGRTFGQRAKQIIINTICQLREAIAEGNSDAAMVRDLASLERLAAREAPRRDATCGRCIGCPDETRRPTAAGSTAIH